MCWNIAGLVLGHKPLEEFELVVPGSLQSIPNELKVVQFFDLGGRQFSVLEIVSLAFDPSA